MYINTRRCIKSVSLTLVDFQRDLYPCRWWWFSWWLVSRAGVCTVRQNMGRTYWWMCHECVTSWELGVLESSLECLNQARSARIKLRKFRVSCGVTEDFHHHLHRQPLECSSYLLRRKPQECSSYILSDYSLALYPPESMSLSVANGRHLPHNLPSHMVAWISIAEEFSLSPPSPNTRS